MSFFHHARPQPNWEQSLGDLKVAGFSLMAIAGLLALAFLEVVTIVQF